jgi:hypothetical protein
MIEDYQKSYVLQRFKEKFYPIGDFETLKARYVAGVDGQDRSIYSENQINQTLSTSSAFITAALAAREKRAVATVDFLVAHLICHLMVKKYS